MNKKLLAVLEVTLVFALVMTLIAIIAPSKAAGWVRNATHNSYLEYIVMIAVPLLILLIARRNLADYGISLKNTRYHFDIAKTTFLPAAVSCVPFAVVNYRQWGGALILVAVQIALLYVVARMLKNKTSAVGGAAMAVVAFAGNASSFLPKFSIGNAFSALIFYVFFLGIGEELLFRGYIQSRLNTAFGKPFTFFGVQWGWGAIIACALFGVMHFLNLGSLSAGQWVVTPAWGFWTFFGGLVFAYIREKTGSITSSAILHGLPQGLAAAFMGM